MPRLYPVDYDVLICIFEKQDFTHSRTKGDHMIYTKKGNIRPIVIPRYKPVPIFIIKSLLRTAGLEREQYFKLLEECM